MSKRVDYNSKGFGKTYVASRELPAETLSQWLDAIAEWMPPAAAPVIVDLGCGTGRFVEPLAQRFKAKVIGIDPAYDMLKEAKTQSTTPGVHHMCARAEALPICDNSVDLVFLSMVYHHLADRDAALHEIRGVLCPGGRLIIRNATKENIKPLDWIAHFPEARELELRRIPTRADISGEVLAAGFRLCSQEAVTQVFAATYSEYYRKISMRSLSTLHLISDEAFAAGLRRLKGWCEQRWQTGPVRETIDLFVAEKI